MSSSPSAPATPDYVGAANATAAGNLDAARVAAKANRVNQVTPYGNLTYTRQGDDPDAGWTATTELSPSQQGILDSTNTLNQGLMNTANTGLNYANDVLAHPGVDTSKLPQVGIDPGQSYQDAMMARLSPQIDRENSQSDAQLANQGIMQGSEAYNNAKTLLGERHNDLLNNATVQGFGVGQTANQNAFQQSAYNQMQPINVINALRTGSQVQNPQFTQVPQQATTAGADLLGATQAGYNSQLGASNAANASNANNMNGLFQAAGTAAMFMSDRRLKQNIHKIGVLDNGLNLYTFEYKPEFELETGRQLGVMADEVELVIPEAVHALSGGYKAVDYAMVYA